MSTKRATASKAPHPIPADDCKPTSREAKIATEMVERRKGAQSIKLDVSYAIPGRSNICREERAPAEAAKHRDRCAHPFRCTTQRW